uniref:Uncharacterized protein n=1 Tax=Cacopsylla melanoneura TaxID=428564 RepID=A0A8D8TZW9_9HEMI
MGSLGLKRQRIFWNSLSSFRMKICLNILRISAEIPTLNNLKFSKMTKRSEYMLGPENKMSFKDFLLVVGHEPSNTGLIGVELLTLTTAWCGMKTPELSFETDM